VQQGQRNALIRRQLELQNEALEQERISLELQNRALEQQIRPTDKQSSDLDGSFSQSTPGSDILKQQRDERNAFNGYVWRTLTRRIKRQWSDDAKAVDRFYSKPENLGVPVRKAIELVTGKKI
jgi:hypothetical protein